MLFSSKRKGSGHRPSSSSSASSLSSSRSGPTSRHSDPKRHSLDSSTNASNTTRSGPIPRGNGHQAMAIPMPPPPSVYFSLLPSNNNASTSTVGHSNPTSPRLGNKDIADRTLSRSASTKNRRSKQFPPHSDPSTPTVHHPFSFSPFHNSSNNSSRSPSRSASNSRQSSNPNTPGGGAIPIASAGVYNHYHTHHHAPRPTYPLSMTFSRRSSISHGPAGGANNKQGFFDMGIFDPAPEHLPKSARTSIDDRTSHRMTASRPPSIESMNSANSVPFAPPPPPPPSLWKQFTNHFSHRVIKRHIKFIVALYISSALALVVPVANVLGNSPYLANVTVIFMHPARTVGSQLEVTFFSAVGAILAGIWITPCQLAVAAFNQKYRPEGYNAAWAIDAAWFFLGVWIMTTYKTKYAKLNCSFIIYTIAGIFALTRNHTSMRFDFRDFWDLMGPMMLGIAICLIVSIVFWPETASEGLGRALNESLDTSRALLSLSTRFFLLNHNTIALPKSALEKAQAEVRQAQKKLFNAYREARYEVTYSMINPADYKEVRLIVSGLMRHLGSMSLVVQNERLLMLGHPDRDDEDLLTQSGGESNHSSSDSDSESEGEGGNENEPRSLSDTGDRTHQQSDYFGYATAEEALRGSNRDNHPTRRRSKKEQMVESPASEDGHTPPRKQVQRRGSAAELRRVRQLLQRAENTTQATLRARQQHQERMQKEALQQTFQFDRGGYATAPPTPGGRETLSVFGHHQSHRSKTSSSIRADYHDDTGSWANYSSAASSTNSSRPNSIHEEQNMETVKSFKSLFSTRSGHKFKPDRPASLKAGFRVDHAWKQNEDSERTTSTMDDSHYATVPAHIGRGSEDDSSSSPHRQLSRYGLPLRTTLTDQQLRKTAEAFRKQREKEIKRQRKLAENEAKEERQRAEQQRRAEAAARSVPPKEVAFGDRKLFMSFLDIVRDPLQRLSDSCSRVMVAMERELVAGLNVEQDRLERIRRRNAQRADAIRAAEAILAEEEKTAVNGTTTTPNATGGEMPCGETAKKQDLGHTTIFNRIRVFFGVEPRHLSQEDIEYAEALKSGMVKEGKKKKTKPKLSKKGLATDNVQPNKLLQQNAQRNATSSGIDEGNDDFMLPPDMSYVQYLTQELEIFDKAEAEGLRNFISTHPTLDVGPREELFLIFFFLFALREIARELVRLGKYVEELEEKERQKMEEEGRAKRRKQLWWPKVIGNFWHWFAWGSYSQVKTTEGYSSLIMNTTKNLEHRQPGSIEEEKALVEAKAAKVAAEKLATEAATAKATAEKQAEQRRRRHSEMWDMPPLRRSTTLSTFIHRQGRIPDLEMGLGDNHQQMEMEEEERPQRRHVRRHSQGPRSRSNSPMRRRTTWSRQGDPRHRGRRVLNEDSEHNSSIRGEEHTMQQEADLGDPSVLGGKEILNEEFGEEVGCSSRSVPQNSASTKPKSRLAKQYTVVEIPAFGSLQHRTDKDLKHFEDVNLVHLSPHTNVVKPHSSAPPEMDVSKTSKLQKKTSHGVILSAPSSSHQDRYPSFASSTSPALLNGFHNSDSTAANSQSTDQQLNTSKEHLEGLDGNESSTGSEVSTGDRHRHSRLDRKNTKDGKRRSRGLFVSFSRRPSDEISESSTKQQQQSPPALEPVKQPRRMFVSISKPKTWRYRFWELLQPFKSEEFKFGFKMAVGLTFIGMWSWLHWTNVALATDRGQWAMMTVMAVLSPTVGATFSVCAMRVAGTLAGTLWALITYLVLPKDPWVICVMMLFVSFAGVFIILESSNANLGIIMLLSYSSITFIMYEGRSTETIYEVCYKRAITVIVGILVAVILNSLLWPILARRELRKEIAILIGRQGVLFAELVSKFLLEDPRDQQWAVQPHYLTKWSGSDQDDEDEHNGDKLDEKASAMETSQDGLQESFIERAEREERNEKLELSRQRKQKVRKIDGQGASSGEGTTNKGDPVNALRHQMEDPRNALDPDRLAFQHVEQQLQTKLIKISELLALSGSEPRLKEEFPMKLYQQIIQCCQNILDRMISMRMAAQLLSPEVRELVTGPMNYYRRDMVGALLLYFSVLSSSLASKSPLPPYLPSARIARLRVIYNVREAIAAHQAATGENHYTYIYYYAFSSALEEVIEELELLAILIKPIVGVMLVSSGTSYAYALPTGQLNLGAMATGQLGLPPLSTVPDPQPPSMHPHEQHLGVGGCLTGNLPTLAGLPAATMINIGMSNNTTAGQGAGAFGQQLQYPQDLIYEQQRRLEQQQAHQQHQQLQLQIQLQAQQKIIQQQQQQLLLQQQQLGLSFHPDLAIAAPSRILVNPQIVPTTAACPARGDNAIGSSAAAAVSTTSLSSSGSSGSRHTSKKQGTSTIPSSMAKRRSSKPFGLKVATDGPKVDISPPTAGTTGSQILTVDPTNALLAGCATMATSPIMMMDESLLSNRHAQRYKEAIQVAQQASGQQMIEVTPSAEAVPTQIQLPIATVAAASPPSVAGGNNNISPLATTTATVPVIAISPAGSNPVPTTRKRTSIVGGFSFGSKEADNNDHDRNGRRPSFHFHRHRHHKSHDSTRSLKNPMSTSMETDAEGMETEVRSIASSPFGSGMTTEAPLSLGQIPVASAELECGQHEDRASQNETQRK